MLNFHTSFLLLRQFIGTHNIIQEEIQIKCLINKKLPFVYKLELCLG